jgi:hypothetical protein
MGEKCHIQLSAFEPVNVGKRVTRFISFFNYVVGERFHGFSNLALRLSGWGTKAQLIFYS